jgi:uncharacterized membrane protein
MLSSLRPLLTKIILGLKASFWLIPLVMVVVSLVVAPVIIEYDLFLAQRSTGLPDFFPPISTEGAKMILSAIAGSMITVASLVFSITLVALSLMAQQLGPRILQIFMEDRPTQIMLGLFIATFIFAIIVLGSVGFGEGQKFIPLIGVLVTGALAVIAFVAVILFIHHIARQIQADIVIHQTSVKLRKATDDLLEDDKSAGSECVDAAEYASLREEFGEDAREILISDRSGYVQFIDFEAAMKCAHENDVRLLLLCRPGHFILGETSIMLAEPAASVDDKLAKNLQSFVTLSGRRTRVQHVEFEMLALVEIALRALSPGINDPFTAISCIDWLSEGLAQLMRRYPDFRIHRDEQDKIRILEYPQTFERYLKKTLNPIREAASDIPIVLERLEHSLTQLKQLARHSSQIDTIDELLNTLPGSRK